jgi:hypothetical protein
VPVADQFRFLVPPATCAHDRHGDQFAVATIGCRSWARKQGLDLLPQCIHDALHAGSNVVNVRYHSRVLQCRCVCSAKNAHTLLEDLSSSNHN